VALLFRGALRRLFGRFVRSRSGNVAVIFALASIPVIAAMGVAVDYTRLSQVTGDVQDALDATALALSRQANLSTMTDGQIQTFTQNYFAANFNNSDLKDLVLTAAYTPTGPSIKITATGHMPTDFMGIVGTPDMPVSRTSSTIWGEARLRVALVLDTTGSMSSSGKITALKTATDNLLTQLKGAATTDGDVYVSIVPFVRDVNVGSSNYAASWIDWTDWLAEPQILDPAKCWGSPSTCGAKPANWAKYGLSSQGAITSCPFPSTSNYSTYGFGCASSATSTSLVTTIPSTGYICPAGPTSRADTGGKITAMGSIAYNGCYTSVLTTDSSTGSSAACPAASSTNGTYLDGYNGTTNTCSCTGKNSNKKCTWSYISHVWRGDTASAPKYNTSPTTWNGCIADRGAWNGPSSDNYDQNITAPNTSNTATLFPAQQYTSCPSAITPLTYDWTALTNAVSTLYPNGSTNQAIGLVHGWQSLVGGGPYPTPPVEDSAHVYKHVIILLTDGLNTQDRWYGNGSATSTQVNDRQAPLCTNIKNAGITLYTVQVNTDGAATSTLLQNCASSSDKFFLLTKADQMVTTFQQIGTELSDLRISN
jgi:Flp pilus assembly protein TadG